MQYMLLIQDDETRWASVSDAERQALHEEYGAFTAELRAAGAFVEGNQLHRATSATSVRVRDGQTLTTDGPFAETKEQLGGYYVVEADSLDAALAWAAKIPSARTGTIEVRPVVMAQAEARA